MTKFEKIKAMSVEEMAVFCDSCSCKRCIYYKEHELHFCNEDECIDGITQWLESEADKNMLPEICSCGYRFEADETICPNCGKKVEEDG